METFGTVESNWFCFNFSVSKIRNFQTGAYLEQSALYHRWNVFVQILDLINLSLAASSFDFDFIVSRNDIYAP